MSNTNSITPRGFLSSIPIKASYRLGTRLSLHCSMNHQDQIRFLDNNRLKNIRRTQIDDQSRRSFIVHSVVQPGTPPPSEPPFNFLKWMLGAVLTVVVPFFSHKWVSLLKIKNEVETVVSTIEEIVEDAAKVAEGVEKMAEDIADDLPEGGQLRKAVDFIEKVAERTSKDAHLVDDFIDKVQEADERAEEFVESLVHHHPKEEDKLDDEPPKEANEADAPYEEENDDDKKQ
ncbi:hypothetical protein ACJIZ3_002862 [Penstemon smallii]|uniref:Uncharacterized protein n=1 Tax=Penstemon smallii TaxID=265156 RepID=A0ABD3U7K3_9LAMI